MFNFLHPWTKKEKIHRTHITGLESFFHTWLQNVNGSKWIPSSWKEWIRRLFRMKSNVEKMWHGKMLWWKSLSLSLFHLSNRRCQFQWWSEIEMISPFKSLVHARTHTNTYTHTHFDWQRIKLPNQWRTYRVGTAGEKAAKIYTLWQSE